MEAQSQPPLIEMIVEPAKQTQDQENVRRLRGGCGLWECLTYVFGYQRPNSSAALCCLAYEECCVL